MSPAPGARRLRTAGWYALLTALSLLVLFPIWMTIVRALSGPGLVVVQEGQPPYPVDIEWDVFSRAWNEADFSRQFQISPGGGRSSSSPAS